MADKENNPKVTYDSLLKDDEFLNSAYWSLKDLGGDPTNNRKEILDSFLNKMRWFETNIFSTYNTGEDIKNLDDVGKQNFAKAYSKYEQMPSIFEKGGAGTGKALLDYLAAGVFDPTNLFSAIAGAFTAGAGGAATFAAKETAKRGVLSSLAAPIKAMGTKGVAKALAVEGTVAGSGGSAQNLLKQDVEKEVGLRKDTDYGQAALQGLVEGIASPVAGVLGNSLTSGAVAGTKKVSSILKQPVEKLSSKVLNRDVDLEKSALILKNYFLPTAGVNENTRRLVERNLGIPKSLNNEGLELTRGIQSLIEKSPIKPTDIPDPNYPNLTFEKIINKSFEGDTNAQAILNRTNPELGNLINVKFRDVAHRAALYGLDSKIPAQAKGYFNNNDGYATNVVDAYLMYNRKESFEDFLTKNPDVLSDLELAIKTNPNKFKKSVPIFGQDNTIVASPDQVTKAVRDYAQQKYTASRSKLSETGAYKPTVSLKAADEVASYSPEELLVAKQDYANRYNVSVNSVTPKKLIEDLEIPKPLKKILGYNNTPALRAVETISAITTSSSKANVAGDLAEDAISTGKAFKLNPTDISSKATKAERLATARAVSGDDTLIPFVEVYQKGMGKTDSPFVMQGMFVTDDLKNTFVRQDYARQLKTLFDEDGLFSDSITNNAVLRSILQVQNFAKAGKTIFSPIAMVRNIGSAVGYAAASGNTKGMFDSVSIAMSNPATFKQYVKEFNDSGLSGSSIDVNQALKRFGDITDEYNPTRWNNFITSGGLSIFGDKGKKLSRVAKNFYQGTDNTFKLATYIGEREKAKKLLAGMSDIDKQNQINLFSRQYNKPLGTFTEEDIIKELAARKTANITPVYDRVSPILEKMRTIPIVGSFTAYPAERIRNSYNILKLGTDELRQGFQTGNKELTKIGAARLAQWYATQSALYAGAYYANQQGTFIGGKDGSTVIESMRNFLSPWEKNSPILLTGLTKEGRPKYIDLGYMNPDQYLISAYAGLVAKASRGEDVTEDLGKAVIDAGAKIAEPFISQSLALDFGKGLLGIAEAKDDASLTNSVVTAYKALEPGYLKIGRDFFSEQGLFPKVLGKTGSDIERALKPAYYQQGVEGRRGEDLYDSLKRTGVGIPGLREKVFDPKTALGFALNSVKEEATSERNNFTKNLRQSLTDPLAVTSMSSIAKDYNDNLLAQFERQKAIYKMTKDLRKLGYKTNDIFKLFQEQGLVGVVSPSKKELISILDGEFKSLNYGTRENKKFWGEIAKSIEQEKPSPERYGKLRSAKNAINEVEKYYKNLKLNQKPPELEITGE